LKIQGARREYTLAIQPLTLPQQIVVSDPGLRRGPGVETGATGQQNGVGFPPDIEEAWRKPFEYKNLLI